MSSICCYCKHKVETEDIHMQCGVCETSICIYCEEAARYAGCKCMFNYHIDRIKCCFCVGYQVRMRKEVLHQLEDEIERREKRAKDKKRIFDNRGDCHDWRGSTFSGFYYDECRSDYVWRAKQFIDALIMLGVEYEYKILLNDTIVVSYDKGLLGVEIHQLGEKYANDRLDEGVEDKEISRKSVNVKTILFKNYLEGTLNIQNLIPALI
jgi:hypothetical protein